MNKKMCVICGEEITQRPGKAKSCIKQECQEALKKIIRDNNNIKNHIKKKIKELGEEEYNKLPKCLLCTEYNYHADDLKQHVYNRHNMSIEEYREKFNLTTKDTLSEKTLKKYSDKMSGDKNPGYQHNGTLSPFSPKFYMRQGYSEEESIKLAKAKEKEARDNTPRENINTCIEYYLKQGYNKKQAELLRSQRQTTFSKEICIEKHGEEKGLMIWEERQNKWQDNLNSKPDEEKQRINKLKSTGGCKTKISKESLSFFIELETELIQKEICKHNDILYANENNFFTEFSLLKEDNITFYYYDFLIKNLKIIIEYNGSIWHPRPENFETWKSPHPNDERWKNITAEMLYAKDVKKIELAKYNGYKILEIFDKDKNKIEKCLSFIESNLND